MQSTCHAEKGLDKEMNGVRPQAGYSMECEGAGNAKSQGVRPLTQSFLKVLGLMSKFRPRPTLRQPMAGMIKCFMKQPLVARSHE